MKKKILVMRGIPGSGKSTWVRNYKQTLVEGTFVVIANDDSYEHDGPYTYTPERSAEAYNVAKAKFAAAYADPAISTIIIDNINIYWHQIGHVMGGAVYDDRLRVEVVEFVPQSVEFHTRRNTHGVAASDIEQMISTWQNPNFKSFGWKHTRIEPQGA